MYVTIVNQNDVVVDWCSDKPINYLTDRIHNLFQEENELIIIIFKFKICL